MRLRFSRINIINFLINHSGVLGRRLADANASGGGVSSRAPRTTRNLGEAPSTFQGDQAAYHLWAAYRRSRLRPITIDKTELEHDNAESLIMDLCMFASSRLIPINFDENLERPTGSTSKRYVVPSTLEKYIGKVIKYFREVDPDHPDWKDLNRNDQTAVPSWWSTLRPAFRREAQTYQLLHVGDGVFGLEDIRPLYADLGLTDEDGKYPLRVCDQKHVFVHLVRTAAESNDNLQSLAIIHAVAEAIGRGGEAKFQTFRDWVFDYLWKVTNTPWKEKKTTNSYAMARVADSRWYADWYFIMGMYCMCEKGLYRSPAQKSVGLGQAVFTKLHQMRDESATTFVTETIRAALPSLVGKYFSAKSLRQAGVNQVSKHPDINLFHLCQITGHATGNTTDDYRDSNDVGRVIPGVNALHGKKNIFTEVAIPRLEALGREDQKTALKWMDQVFPCNIESFKDGGELNIIKQTFLASLLMHYEELGTDCGVSNRVTSTLRDKAEAAKITCSDRPSLPTDRVLLRWSAQIKKDFKEQERINEMKVLDPPGNQYHAMMAEIVENMKSLQTTVQNLTDKFDEMVSDSIEKETQISNLQRQNYDLRKEVNLLNNQAALRSQQLMTTPDGGRSVGNKRLRTRDAVAPLNINSEVDTLSAIPANRSPSSDAGSPTAATTSTNVASTTTTESAAAAAVATPLVTTVAATPLVTTVATTRRNSTAVASSSTQRDVSSLWYGHAADQVATGASKSLKNKTFADAIVDLVRPNNYFKVYSKLGKAPITKKQCSEPSHLVSCLELADFIAETETNNDIRQSIQVLRDATSETDEVKLHDEAGNIEQACLAELNVLIPFEGNGQPKATISGMARRINMYKKEIKQKKNLPENLKPSQIPLQYIE